MPPISVRAAINTRRQSGRSLGSTRGSCSVMTQFLETRAELAVLGDFDENRDLILGEALATERVHASLQRVERLRLLQVEARGHYVAHHCVRLAEHRALFDIVELQQHALDLGRIYLLPADV